MNNPDKTGVVQEGARRCEEGARREGKGGYDIIVPHAHVLQCDVISCDVTSCICVQLYCPREISPLLTSMTRLGNLAASSSTPSQNSNFR